MISSEYQDVDDQAIRTAMVACLIKAGKHPEVGFWFGFACQLREWNKTDKTASAIGEKIWCQINVTEEDLYSAYKLCETGSNKYSH